MALAFGDGLITCGFGRLVVVNWLNDWRLVVGGGLDRLVVVLRGRIHNISIELHPFIFKRKFTRILKK